MSLCKAIAAEQSGDILTAIDCYESLISSSTTPPAEAFINLIFIYFLLLDPSFRQSIPDVDKQQFNGNEPARIAALFKKGKALHPDSMELKFWENNISLICPWLNHENYSSIDPYFFKQSKTYIPYYLVDIEDSRYAGEINALRELVRPGKTCKERYIKNIIG